MKFDRQRAATTIAALGALVGAAGLAGTAADAWWFLDLFAHFRVQYAVLLALCAIGLALLGRHWVAAGCLALAVANATFAMPYLRAAPAGTTEGAPLRIVSLNVYKHSVEYERVRAYLRAERPDFVVLVEATPAWERELAAPLRDLYPHAAYSPRAGASGVLLLSRTPILEWLPVFLGGAPESGIRARIAPFGHPVDVLGVHLTWPMRADLAAQRNRELEGLARVTRAARVPLVVLGDFNDTRYSPTFARLLRDGALRDCAAGRGLSGTWPAGFAPLWIQIDHCLHTRGVWTESFDTGPRVGSDHYPLVVTLRVPDSAGLADGSPAPAAVVRTSGAAAVRAASRLAVTGAPAVAGPAAVVAMPPVSARRIAASTGMSSGWTETFGTKIVYPPTM